MTNLGFCVGLPAGPILERFGPKWASALALIISTIGYTGFYLALVYPKEFGTSLFWLLVTSVFVVGKFSHWVDTYPAIKRLFYCFIWEYLSLDTEHPR